MTFHKRFARRSNTLESVKLKQRILCHRGLWASDQEGNSSASIMRAVSEGFGVEFDLRDRNGEAVIVHDPPEQHVSLPTLSQVIADIPANVADTFLAINIKSDGLVPLLPSIPYPHFFFDMSVPDQIAYQNAARPVATRVSEYEPLQGFEEAPSAQYLWIDAFDSDWYLDPDTFERLMHADSTKVFVSPELHGRKCENLWNTLRPLFLARDDLMICTDYPLKFLESI